MAGRNGHGNGDTADLTLRLLREMRAQMVTKDDLARAIAKVETRLDDRVDSLELRLGRRIDVLRGVFKQSHRVLTSRLRAVESRLGSARR